MKKVINALACLIVPVKMSMLHRWCLGMVVVVTMGCSSGEQEGRHISGTVTFQGTPIPYGKIEFTPNPALGNQAPVGFAAINDGKFDTRRDGHAVVPGANLVRIYGFEGEPGQVPTLEERVPLFDSYETSTEIKVDQPEHDFDVPGRAR